jgi:hypothetical protein
MVSGHAGRRGLLHACVDASASVEGWKRGRGPSAFSVRYLSRHSRPWLCADGRPQAHRSLAPRSPDAQSCEAWAREKAGGVSTGSRARDGSRDRASGEAGMVGRGALRRERCIRKNADGPLPCFHPAAVPDVSRKASCAPQRPTCRDTGAARGDSPRVDPRFATESTKTQKRSGAHGRCRMPRSILPADADAYRRACALSVTDS